MISRKTVLLLIGLFTLGLAAAASAQPRWGRQGMPQAGACFFTDKNFKGDRFCVRPGEQLPSLSKGMGDKISSIRLAGGAEVTVFRDKDMRGRIRSDTPNLRGNGATRSRLLTSSRSAGWFAPSGTGCFSCNPSRT